MLKESPIRLLDQAEGAWHEPKGLIAALILVTLIVAGFSASVGLSASGSVSALLLGAVIVVIVWWISRQPKKTKKDKIGFGVSLHCDKELETEIHDDFVTSLRRLILSGKSSQLFDFLEIPPRIAAKTLDIQSAEKMRQKIRCHFFLFGRVRKRNIANTTRYFLELDGIVAHKAIAPEIQERFSAEFSALLPRKMETDETATFAAFDFTSRLADAVSKYIIGIAMTLSGFYDEAESMLREASSLASKVSPAPPTCEKIIEQVAREVSAINLVRADSYYARWRDEGFDEVALDSMGAALKKVDHASRAALTLKAIHLFLASRDTHGARSLLYQVKKSARDGVWEYNQGFLFAYDGNLKKARKHFIRGAHQRIPLRKSIAELELFICWVIEQDPDRHQLHFALGLLNWHLKGDFSRAIHDFEEFLDLSKQGRFDREQALAKLWVGDLARRLKSS